MAIFQPTPCPSAGGMPPITCLPAPTVIPYKFGAITAFDVIDETNEHARFGVFYESLACLADVLPMPDNICPPDAFVKVPTFGDESAHIQGCPFSLYAAIDCRRFTLDSMTSEVEQIFRYGEPRALEAAIWTNVLAQPTTSVLNTVAGPPGAMGFLPALAALESFMAGCYPGIPTIHADRGMMAYGAKVNAFKPLGDSAYTPLGSRWALYGGNPNTGPDGTPAPPGHTWIYATSQLTLRRFPQQTLVPDFPLQKDANGGQTNVPYALTERTYVATVECCRAAVLVCLDLCDR